MGWYVDIGRQAVAIDFIAQFSSFMEISRRNFKTEKESLIYAQQEVTEMSFPSMASLEMWRRMGVFMTTNCFRVLWIRNPSITRHQHVIMDIAITSRPLRYFQITLHRHQHQFQVHGVTYLIFFISITIEVNVDAWLVTWKQKRNVTKEARQKEQIDKAISWWAVATLWWCIGPHFNRTANQKL